MSLLCCREVWILRFGCQYFARNADGKFQCCEFKDSATLTCWCNTPVCVITRRNGYQVNVRLPHWPSLTLTWPIESQSPVITDSLYRSPNIIRMISRARNFSKMPFQMQWTNLKIKSESVRITSLWLKCYNFMLPFLPILSWMPNLRNKCLLLPLFQFIFLNINITVRFYD